MKLSHKTYINILKKAGIFISVSFMLLYFSGCSLQRKKAPVMDPMVLSTNKVTYDTVEVKKGTIISKIAVQGTLEAVIQQDVFLKQSGGGNIAKVYVKEGDTVKAGDVLAELDTSDIQAQIKEENINLQMAGIDLEQLKNTSGTSTYDIQRAEMAVKKEQVTLDNLNMQLENSKIVAGISGKIIQSSDPKAGQHVDAYQPIFTIADPDNIQIKCTGKDIENFKTGMKVNIIYGDKTYTGTVATSTEDIPDSISSRGEKYMKVKTDSVIKNAKLGDNVSINVEVEKKDNVIVISKQLVRKYAERPYVELLIGGNKIERYIETGMENDDSVEVVSGLSEGDKIIK